MCTAYRQYLGAILPKPPSILCLDVHVNYAVSIEDSASLGNIRCHERLGDTNRLCFSFPFADVH